MSTQSLFIKSFLIVVLLELLSSILETLEVEDQNGRDKEEVSRLYVEIQIFPLASALRHHSISQFPVMLHTTTYFNPKSIISVSALSPRGKITEQDAKDRDKAVNENLRLITKARDLL